MSLFLNLKNIFVTMNIAIFLIVLFDVGFYCDIIINMLPWLYLLLLFL